MFHVAPFFAGLFLCNALPHLVSGVTGQVFPSPFAKPRGRGASSPLVNTLWGGCNLLVGLFLLAMQPVGIGTNADFALLSAGVVLTGVFASIHFGKGRREDPTFGARR